MKTIFDETTLNELIDRISRISETRNADWGNMNIYPMLKHCTQCEEMMLGKKNYKRAFLSRLFGKIALKDLIELLRFDN